MITVPVTLILAKLSSYMVLVLVQKCFLFPGAKLSDLRTAKNTTNGKLKASTTVANGGMIITSGPGDKLLNFKALNYYGDYLNDNKWISSIELAFSFLRYGSFLTIKTACGN